MAPTPPIDGTSPDPQRDAKLDQARKHVRALKGFYIHLFVFALVMLGLTFINFISGGSWWVLFVFLGWGFGVLGHALAVFSRGSQRIAHWEERKIKTLMDQK